MTSDGGVLLLAQTAPAASIADLRFKLASEKRPGQLTDDEPMGECRVTPLVEHHSCAFDFI